MIQKNALHDLPFKNNFMFCAVMSRENVCREFLEMLLGFPIEEVQVDYEKSILYHPEYKSVRLDIMARDEKHRRYNVEMQVGSQEAIGKRVRYYHSQMDIEMLGTGVPYAQLPDSYVIFLCDFDPFGAQRYRYVFENRCLETGESMGDGCRSIFLSTCGKNPEEVPKRLVNFLNFVREDLKNMQVDYEDSLIQNIQKAMNYVKSDRRLEVNYMLLQELIDQERRDAKAEGKAEGRAEAILEIISAYGPVSEDIRQSVLEERDLEVLGDYLKAAVGMRSMDEFEKIVR